MFNHPTYNGPWKVVTVEIALIANELAYNLPDKASFKAPYKVLGIAHRAYHADRRTETGKTLPTDATIKKGFVILKDMNRKEIIRVPLETILEDLTGYKQAYYVNPAEIDPAESLVIFANGTSISAGPAIELQLYVTDDAC